MKFIEYCSSCVFNMLLCSSDKSGASLGVFSEKTLIIFFKSEISKDYTFVEVLLRKKWARQWKYFYVIKFPQTIVYFTTLSKNFSPFWKLETKVLVSMGVCNASFFILTFLWLSNSILRMNDVGKNVSRAPGSKKIE